ncbi:MAG TPA: M3 family metallopeptidase, partial [Ferruginibacter sp.]|nr:M3 family metallopeptidase [Ferruginibacter sp.]
MPAAYTADIRKLPRQYLPADFVLTDWPSIEPFFVELNSRELNSLAALEQWLLDQSEVEAAVSENACWRQIRMTCDTENKELEASFNDYYLNIQPQIQRYSDLLNRKMLDCPFLDQLDPARYFTYLRNIRKSIELFREENLSIQSEIAVLQQQYGQITGAMMVEVNGQEYTMQQAGKFLQSPDRALRETVYRKVQARRLESKPELDALYNKLIALRNQEARQAGFNSYTEYRFKELGRFDYTAEDCFRFHEAVKQHVLPLVSAIHRRKKEKLGLDVLRPWDLDAEPAGIEPLKPFTDGNDLLKKTIDCFQHLRPFFADCLKRMQSLQHLDLDSRKGKAPGGYNCPLAESGAPFIFMNAAGQMSDVTTMVHEGGHAVHSFLAHPLEL